MNIKIIYAGAGFLLGILLAFIIFTNIPIHNGTRNIYPEFRDVIPDEATAIRVAEAILDTYFGTEYKSGTEVEVVFIEDKNTWRVSFGEESLESSTGFSSAGLPMIFLRKDNGMVIGLGLQED